MTALMFEWFAFSSNQRACRMAARCPCMMRPSTATAALRYTTSFKELFKLSCLTVKVGVKLLEVWRDCGDENFHGGVRAADFETALVQEHREHFLRICHAHLVSDFAAQCFHSLD